MEAIAEGYPLQWPAGWPRAQSRQYSNFYATQSQAQQGILHQLKLLKAQDVVISTNVRLRRDGLPYTGDRAPADPGVAVYFILNGQQQCIPCDKWARVWENMRAIEKTIEALRGIERWGAKEMVDAAFRGFQALPAPSGGEYLEADAPWYVILGVNQFASKDEIKVAYREKAKSAHPDQGGSSREWESLQRAYDKGISNAS